LKLFLVDINQGLFYLIMSKWSQTYKSTFIYIYILLNVDQYESNSLNS